MDEGERDRLARVADQQPDFGHSVDRGWEALRAMAIGGAWGRPPPTQRIADDDLWAVRAEVTR